MMLYRTAETDISCCVATLAAHGARERAPFACQNIEEIFLAGYLKRLSPPNLRSVFCARKFIDPDAKPNVK